MNNPIEQHRRFVQNQIQKSFDNELEKARYGVYEDNAENRRLNRVGQEYGHAAQEKQPAAPRQKKQDEESKNLSDSAKEASTGALKRAAADENAKPKIREAAEKELKERGESSEQKKEDKANSISIESIESCNTNIDDSNKNLFAYSIKQSPYHPRYGNGQEQDVIHVRIRANKKDALKEIKSMNEKLGINLSIDDFERTPPGRYGDNTYDIQYNPKTGTWGNGREISDELNSEWYEQNSESEKKAEKKNTMDKLKSSQSFTKESIKDLLDNDEVKDHAFSYFNYGDDGDCSPEEIEQFEKLEKLGAKISDYFDWKEDGDADSYKMKMQAKGYRMFDISTSDGYLWLMIKNNKLSKSETKE